MSDCECFIGLKGDFTFYQLLKFAFVSLEIKEGHEEEVNKEAGRIINHENLYQEVSTEYEILLKHFNFKLREGLELICDSDLKHLNHENTDVRIGDLDYGMIKIVNTDMKFYLDEHFNGLGIYITNSHKASSTLVDMEIVNSGINLYNEWSDGSFLPSGWKLSFGTFSYG